jgi:hypothetical protein
MSEDIGQDIGRMAEIAQILAGIVQDHAWQGVLGAITYIQYLIFTPRGRVDAAKIVSSIAGAFYYIYGKVEGATSGLYGLVTDAWGAAKNVGTPIMTYITPFLGTVARDEAFKAYNQTKNITVDHANTVDVEAEKAKKELIRQIAEFSESKIPGTYYFVYWFLSFFPTAILTKICNMCLNSCNNKGESRTKVNPPAAVEENVAVTPTKRTRARSKSPARKSKAK